MILAYSWCWHSFENCVQDLTLQEAETIALSILKQVMEEKVKLYTAYRKISNIYLLFYSPSTCSLNIPLWTMVLYCLFHFRWRLIMLTLRKWLQRTICTALLRWRLSLAVYNNTMLWYFLIGSFHILGYCINCSSFYWWGIEPLIFLLVKDWTESNAFPGMVLNCAYLFISQLTWFPLFRMKNHF